MWDRLIEQGQEPPAEYFSRPELSALDGFYWRAFTDLSSERSSGMGLGPIPFSAILSYAQFYALDEADAFELLRLIVSRVDSEFLSLNSPDDKTDSKMRSLVPITDAKGIGAMLDRLGKSKA